VGASLAIAARDSRSIVLSVRSPVMFIPRRLDKYVAESTALSLVEVAQAWRAGRITVHAPGEGAPASDRLPIDVLVLPEDTVRLDGECIVSRPRHVHAMLNKPRSVTCTARDPQGKADLGRWLAEMPPALFPIGRLDRMTTGLLLFTTDGDLSNAVLRPEHSTEKTYWLWLNESVDDDDPRLKRLVDGVQRQGRILRAQAVRVQNRTPDFTEVLVTLAEGRNRQLRRMCRALGLHLVHLHRKSVGPLTVGALPLGSWRFLHEWELEQLWAATGGRERVVRRKIRALAARAARARAASAPMVRLETWLERHVPVRLRSTESL
jgi:pseudouridine synthase